MTSKDIVALEPRVMTPSESSQARDGFVGAFGRKDGRALYGALLGLTSAVNDLYNRVQKTDLTVVPSRLHLYPVEVRKVASFPSTVTPVTEVLGGATVGYLAGVAEGLEQGINMVLNLTEGSRLPFDERTWMGLNRNMSMLSVALERVSFTNQSVRFAVVELSCTLQSLCTRLLNLVEFTVARAYDDAIHSSLLPDKFVNGKEVSPEEVYGIPTGLLGKVEELVSWESCEPKTEGEEEREESRSRSESETEDRECMSVEEFEELEEVVEDFEEPECAEEPEGDTEPEEPKETDGRLWDDDGRLLRIPTDEECAQLLQEMEVEAKEAEEGKREVYFDTWSFSGDDEDEIPVRNPLTPPLPPRVFGNAKDGYLPSNVFNAVKE